MRLLPSRLLQNQKLKEATNAGISVQIPPSFGSIPERNLSSEKNKSSKNRSYNSLRAGKAETTDSPRHNHPSASLAPLTPDIIVFGSVAVDLACNFQPSSSLELSPRPHTSNPATFGMSPVLLPKRNSRAHLIPNSETTVGGVGNNVANAISQVLGPKGPTVELRSFIGNDIYGDMILNDLTLRKQSTSGIKVLPKRQTALYTSINNAKREMELAMADMSILDVDQPSWEEICLWNRSDPAPK